MWFKSFLFVHYTSLFIVTVDATFDSIQDVAPFGQFREPRILTISRRQAQWSNTTRTTSENAGEPETAIVSTTFRDSSPTTSDLAPLSSFMQTDVEETTIIPDETSSAIFSTTTSLTSLSTSPPAQQTPVNSEVTSSLAFFSTTTSISRPPPPLPIQTSIIPGSSVSTVPSPTTSLNVRPTTSLPGKPSSPPPVDTNSALLPVIPSSNAEPTSAPSAESRQSSNVESTFTSAIVEQPTSQTSTKLAEGTPVRPPVPPSPPVQVPTSSDFRFPTSVGLPPAPPQTNPIADPSSTIAAPVPSFIDPPISLSSQTSTSTSAITFETTTTVLIPQPLPVTSIFSTSTVNLQLPIPETTSSPLIVSEPTFDQLTSQSVITATSVMEIPLPPIVSSIFLPRPSTSDINVFPPVSSSLRTTRTFGNPEPTPEVPFATDIIPDLSSILSSILSQVQSQLQSIPFPTQGPFQPGISSSVDEVSSTGAPVQTPIFTRPSSLFSGSFSEPSATTRSVPTGEPSLGTSTKSSIPDVSSDFDFSFPSEVIDLSSRSSQTEDRSEFTSSTKTSRTTAISVPTPSVPFESTTGFANTSSTRSATTRPAPGSTSSLSGSTNASTITTSRFFVSPTSSFTTRPTSTSSSSLEVDSLETSSRVPDSASRNSTSTISETTETQSSSSNSTRTSRTPTSTTDISTSSSENGSFSTIASTTTPTQLINSEAAPPPASSSSGVAAGANEPSAPPLSKSQTAGIAIGGTTCLIIAIIAALFLARRYHRNAAANRKSGGSVYPEVAYIYDPPARGDDQTGANSAPMMSGGAAGYGTLPTHSPRYSTGRLPQNPFREPIIPSPEPSPGFNGSGGPAGNIQGQYSDLAVNPFNAAADYPPLSPYGPPAHRFPREPVRASDRYSDPFSDPFEHDLLLNVRSETPDSIVMLAAAPTSSPRSPRSPRYSDRHPPEKNVYGNYLAVAPPTSPAAPHHRGASSLSYSRSNAQSPDSFSYASYAAGRYTPEHLSSSPNHSTNTSFNSSILRTPHAAVSPSPTHKGWDDIKLDQSLIPKPLNLTSGQRPLSQRRQPPLAGNGQTLLSKFGRAMGIDGSYFSKAQNPPAPAVNGPNANPTLHKQQSEEWADPSLIGRPAF